MRIKRSRKVIATGAAFLLIGGTAFAYWTAFGSGSSAAATKATVADIVVTQVVSRPLAPGESVALTGRLINRNATDIKVGELTATVTVPDGVAPEDFTVTGTADTNGKIVQKGTPATWSGLALNYANSALDQNSGKNISVTINYTLAEFQGAVVPAGPPLGTSTVVTDPITGVMSLSIHINTLSTLTWDGKPLSYTIQAGDVLQVMSYHGSVVYTDLATADANGAVLYEGSPTAAEVGAGSQYLQLAVNSNGVTVLGSGPGTMLRYTAP